MRHRAAVGLAALSLGLGALSPALGACATTTDGIPAAGQSRNTLFDPCAVSEHSLRAAGVGPEDLFERGFLGGPRTEWDICGWKNGWYYLEILSTTYSLDAILTDPNSYDVRPVAINTRSAISYQSHIDTPDTVCDVAYSWREGTVIVRVAASFGTTIAEPVCTVATEQARILEPALPQP